jgi:hypothetical protein
MCRRQLRMSSVQEAAADVQEAAADEQQRADVRAVCR